ncbi:MAG: aromatic ring-hydroxylating dioxygenase subunit alpha [Simkaniaceae bacterium]|nr:MAG: aromatic ring-hydroxylating dioxygenase subunit alpha [Simkaniaceae bacterium]
MNNVQFSYPVGFTKNIQAKPVRVMLLGSPIVLFRGADQEIVALEDRCPHRGAPLSGGRVDNGSIVCPYHGWTFGKEGKCSRLPGLPQCKPRNIHAAKPFKVTEKYGLIWIGEGKIPEIPEWETHDCFYMENEVESTLLHVMENALDPLHTLFVHNGWIRKQGKEKDVKVTVTISEDEVLAETFEESAQEGLIHRLLTLGREVTRSYGRVVGSNCFQLGYDTSKGDQLRMTAFLHPVSEGVTKVYTANLYQTTLPNWLFMRLAKVFFEIAIKQDTDMLKLQSNNLKHWNTERFVSTQGDFMGPWIEKILKGEKLIPKRYEVQLNV